MEDKIYNLNQDRKNSRKELIGKELCGHQKIIFAYIFGSFLSSGSFSDIDIGIYTDNKNLPDKALQIEFELERELENSVHIQADVRILNFAPLSFVFNAIKTGTLVLDRNRLLRSDFEGLTFKKYFDYRHLRDEYLKEVKNAPL